MTSQVTDDVSLIDLDEIALAYDADTTTGECLINIHNHPLTSPPSLVHPVTCTSTSPSGQVTYATPVSDDNLDSAAAADPPLLPPVTAIRPPRPRRTSDLPPPQVSTGSGEAGSEPAIARRFNGPASLGLAASEIFVGVCCIILGIAAVIMRVSLYFVGVGIWAGCVCCSCGIIGVLAYKMKTSFRISMYMAMSIISSFCAVCIFVISIVASVDIGSSGHPPCYSAPADDPHCSSKSMNASLAINLTMCIVSMVDLTLSLASFAVAAKARCSTSDCCGCYGLMSTGRWVNDGANLSFANSGDGSVLGVDNVSFSFRERPPPYSPAEPPPSYTDTNAEDPNK